MTDASRGATPGTIHGDVIVVGGGVIGTAIAWRAARAVRAGSTVTLIDPGDLGAGNLGAGDLGAGDLGVFNPRAEDKASLVAAGMLGPVSEAVFGEQDLLNLNLHAIDRFPAFNRELEEATGMTTGLRTEGTLAVAYDSGDLAALDRLTDFRHSIGLAAERLDARECRRREPFLAPATQGGVLATGDLSVDNRRYLAALRAAAAASGVRTVRGTVTRVLDGQVLVTVPGNPAPGNPASRASGPPEETLSARHIVIAAGHATRALDGVPEEVRAAIRPVKGQILRLRHPANIPPILTRTVRAIVRGHDLYLVPRADGELVVGATQEERDDRDVTVGAVHDLLRDAATAVPAVSELIFAEASAGLRPGTSDNGPILGEVHIDHSDNTGYARDPGNKDDSANKDDSGNRGDPGDGGDSGNGGDTGGNGSCVIAAGHFRNGILLSAVTAEAVVSILGGRETHPAWAPFRPGRFKPGRFEPKRFEPKRFENASSGGYRGSIPRETTA